MRYKLYNLILKTDEPLNATPSKVRGYIGREFKEYNILHNHYGDENFLYRYPLVQYKVIDGNIHILGIGDGGEVLKKISSEINVLNLDKKYDVNEKIIHEKEFDIKPSLEEKHYKFITPWLGLNQNNYGKFMNSKSWKEKKEILNKVLVGNIISMSKGLGIIVNKRLYAKTHLEEEIVEYKGIKMNAFTGEFKVHYDLPDFFGLGKGVSQGFGCVKQIFDEE